MLDTTTWVRIAAAGFVALAIALTAIGSAHRPAPIDPAPALSLDGRPLGNGSLVAALERCEGVTDPAAVSTCERVWAQNRRRFLGLPAEPAHGPAAATALGPPP